MDTRDRGTGLGTGQGDGIRGQCRPDGTSLWLAPPISAAADGDLVSAVGRGSADPAPETDRRSPDASIHQIPDMSRELLWEVLKALLP
jgi:hypothetical protein